MLSSYIVCLITWHYTCYPGTMHQPHQSNPWERQPGEPAASYKHFVKFMHMGPDRTVPQLADIVGRSATTLRTYCSKFGWYPRALAWDSREEALLPSNNPAVVEATEAAQDQLRAWRLARELATATLERMIAKTEEDPDFIPLSIKDAAAVLRDCTTYERLILGLPTSQVGTGASRDYSKLSVEESEQLIALISRTGQTSE